MKYKVMDLFLFMEKDWSTGSDRLIKQGNVITNDGPTFTFEDEDGDKICFYSFESPDLDIEQRKITAYWPKYFSDSVKEGNFFIKRQRALYVETDSDDEKNGFRLIDMGDVIDMHGHIEINLDNGDANDDSILCINDKSTTRKPDVIFEIRKTSGLVTLLIPREDGYAKIDNVEKSFCIREKFLFYCIEHQYLVLWFEQERIQPLGVKIARGVFDLAEKKTIYAFDPNKGLTEILPYLSVNNRGYCVVVEVATGAYRVFRPSDNGAIEVTQEHFLCYEHKNTISILRFDNGVYRKASSCDHVVRIFENAFIMKEELDKYALYGLEEGRPIFLKRFRDWDVSNAIELITDKDIFKLNQGVLTYTPVRRKWWQFR